MFIMLHAYSTLEFLHAFTWTYAAGSRPALLNGEVVRHIVPAVYR
jgi:hypothetical protein